MAEGVETTDTAEGEGLVRLALGGTAVFVVAAVLGGAAPDTLGPLTAVVAGVLFLVGSICFLWGYFIGIGRSRAEQVTMAGLFLLSHTAPRAVRIRLRGALAVQVVVAVTVALARTYTVVAFSVLAPMFGLGIMALWAARYGSFFPKDDVEGPRRPAVP